MLHRQEETVPFAEIREYGGSPRVGGVVITFAVSGVLAAIVLLAFAQRRSPGRKDQVLASICVLTALFTNAIQWFSRFAVEDARPPLTFEVILSGAVDVSTGFYGWAYLSLAVGSLVLVRGLRLHGWTALQSVCLAHSVHVLASSVSLLTFNAWLPGSSSSSVRYGAYVHVAAAIGLFAVNAAGAIVVGIARRRATRTDALALP